MEFGPAEEAQREPALALQDKSILVVEDNEIKNAHIGKPFVLEDIVRAYSRVQNSEEKKQEA